MSRLVRGLIVCFITVVVYPLAEYIQEYLAQFEIILWEHFPGIITGVIWSILAFSASTLWAGSTITLPSIKKTHVEAKSAPLYSQETLKAFASKMLRIRLSSKYLHLYDAARNKEEYCNKLVDEVFKASPPKPQ